MRTFTPTRAVAWVLAGSLAIGAASPTWAAPVLSSTASLKTTAPDHITDVRWRGRGARFGIGLATGALIGAAIASSYRSYYDYPYYYGSPYPYPYAYPPAIVYEPPPVYVGPEPVYGGPVPVYPRSKAGACWVYTDKDRGMGYWRC